jgi:peptidyl-dipeptidase Dcp
MLNAMKSKLIFAALIVLVIFACAKNEKIMTNPLLSKFETPFNTIPFDKIKTEYFEPAFDTAFGRARSEIDLIVKDTVKPNFENTIVKFEESGELLGDLDNILENLNMAETDTGIQAVVRKILPQLTEFTNDLTLDPKLFHKVKTVYDNTDKSKLTVEQQMLLETTFKLFVRNGANLSDSDKKEFRAVTKELSELMTKFDDNVLAETNAYTLHITDSADLAGLPKDVIVTAADEAVQRKLKGWVFTLKYPSFDPFLRNADNRKLRKEISIAYNTRCLKNNANDNRDVIKRLADLRLKQANLLGYATYADFALSERMAETPVKVYNFLNEMLKSSMPVAKLEVEEVKKYALSLGSDINIEGWDWRYYSEKLKKQKFDINDEETRPYFKLENVQKGVFELAKRLYGLSFKENKLIPVYNPDVTAYEVYDENGKYLAVLYLDFFPRDGKQQGAWATTYKQQHKKDGIDYRPHISLVFNFTKPTSEKPSLLTYEEVRTFLHEFGHGLHNMLSDVTYASLAGAHVYRDFVELPSQIMENWAEEKQWLDLVTNHYLTGEKMPDIMLQKIIDSKNFNSGYFIVGQLSYGFTDMAWYTITQPFKGDVIAFENKATANTRLLPEVEGTGRSTAFNHIFTWGYSAGYYGYLWANVLDADAFSLFQKNGIFDKKTAKSFRDNILSKGGTEKPMDLYIRFTGHEPSIEPFLIKNGLEKK